MRSGETGKGLLRAQVRRGSRSTKSPRVTRKFSFREPSACEHCGAVYLRKTWRRRSALARELFDRAVWTTCPACDQAARGEFYGRITARAALGSGDGPAIRRRVANVVRRAMATQPERKLVSFERSGDDLEILTTSQKLAHRIAKELVKAFGGEVSYSWSDRDGSLAATWTLGRPSPEARQLPFSTPSRGR